MEDRTTLITVSLILFGCIVILGVGTWMSQQKEQQSGPSWHTMRFTALPGTTRENAQILTSKREASGATGSEVPDPNAVARPIRSLGSEDEGPEADAGPDLAERATELVQTGDVEGLEAMLAHVESEEERAQVQVAMAEAHLNAYPPQYAQARAALDEAAAAQSPVSGPAIAAAEARLLLLQDKPEEACALIEKSLEEGQAPVPAQVQLHVLHAQAAEASADTEAAVTRYEAALAAAQGMIDVSADTAEMLRLAGLRLSRHYRALGDTPAAEDVARRLKAIVGRQP